MLKMNIGVEIEFTGITRKTVAKELANVWGTKITMSDHKERECFCIQDEYDRTWMIYDDRSILPVMPEGGVDSSLYRCELVPPILTTGRFKDLYDVLSIIRSLWGVVNHTCGVHIHIDCPSVGRFVDILSEVLSQQNRICDRFGVSTYRISKYCKLYDERFIEEFEDNKSSFSSIADVVLFFANRLNEGYSITDVKAPMRYYLVNVNSIFTMGTVEFRFFPSTLSFDVIQLYKNWVMQMTL